MGGGACAWQAEDHLLQLLAVRQLAAQAGVSVLDILAGPTLTTYDAMGRKAAIALVSAAAPRRC